MGWGTIATVETSRADRRLPTRGERGGAADEALEAGRHPLAVLDGRLELLHLRCFLLCGGECMNVLVVRALLHLRRCFVVWGYMNVFVVGQTSTKKQRRTEMKNEMKDVCETTPRQVT